MDASPRALLRRFLAVCLLFSALAGGLGLLLEALRLDQAAREAALTAALATTLLLYPIFHVLHRRMRHSLEAVVRSHLDMAVVLGAAVAQRDSDTGAHNFRVALYAIRLAEALGDARENMVTLVLGAFLHDVGKIGIRDAILLKPGSLGEAEFAVMRTHVQRGLDIIGSSQWLLAARPVVQYHHERFDGRGYPEGLGGSEIPLEARVFAIVDVFDALTSQRPYHRPMPFEDAMKMMDGEAGRHFDPALLAAFWRVAEEAHRNLNRAADAELEDRLMTEVGRHRAVLYAAELAASATT